VSSGWPYLIVLVVLAGMFYLSVRNRRRMAAAEADRVKQIGVGTEVMTTSGLYGTVVAKNDDDTVQLSVAPGVELKWALAALRDVADLPDRYRRAAPGPGGEHGIFDKPETPDDRPGGGAPGPEAGR
jgi:preprotein translocase subunit YajC